MSIRHRLSIGTVVALVSLPALAHPGATAAHDFWAGLIHPVTGFDHLLMLVLIGAWLSRSRAGWRSGVAVTAGLVAGTLFTGGALPLSVTEGLVMLSVPGAAAAAAMGFRGPAAAALLSLGMFFHGQAHVTAVGDPVTLGLAIGLALGSITVALIAGGAVNRLWDPVAGDSVRADPVDC